MTEEDSTLDRIPRMIGPPHPEPSIGAVMIWNERKSHKPDDEIDTLMWHIETEEELQQAQWFYDAVNYCRWQSEAELQRLLSGEGPWLIRQSDQFGHFACSFLATCDEELLLSLEAEAAEVLEEEQAEAATEETEDLEDSAEATIDAEELAEAEEPEDDLPFVDEPAEALLFNANEALRWTLALNTARGVAPVWLFEPVLPEEAFTDFRCKMYEQWKREAKS